MLTGFGFLLTDVLIQIVTICSFHILKQDILIIQPLARLKNQYALLRIQHYMATYFLAKNLKIPSSLKKLGFYFDKSHRLNLSGDTG